MTLNSSKEIVLICDIGGTKVRFGLYTEGQEGTVEFDKEYKCLEFKSFEEAVQTYLDTKKEKPTLCVIGAAGSLNEYTGEVLTTNTPWKASVPKLKAKFPLIKHFRLVNDFALQGWALPELTPDQYRPLFTKEKSVDLTRGKIVVIGPGTGLGTCLILQDRNHEQQVFTSEAGHSTMPHVDFRNDFDNATNIRLLHILKNHYTTKGQHPITEHIVSGTGITNVYHALKDGYIPVDKKVRIPSEKVEELAQKGDEIALQTFKIFFAYLGAHAGTMAATTLTENIFFCGGLMASPWVLEQLEHSVDFKEQFVSRAGMTDAMKTVRFEASLYRNMATLGAVVRAKHLIETTNNEEEKNKATHDVVTSLATLQELIDKQCPHVRRNFNKVKKAIEYMQKVQSKEVHPRKVLTPAKGKKQKFRGRGAREN